MRKLRVALLLSFLISSCSSSFVARPPQPEDEVARLRREITKVRFAIDSTKELIDRARGQAYHADLYLRLAELYIEEARYHYFIAYEGQKKRERAVVSVQARLLKNQAIGTYRRILDEFPEFKDSDKVLFFIAHEYRELGEYDQMISYLQRVINEHKNSPYRNEALLVLGDYHFDRSELPQAERYYEQIIESPESPTHAMARYKLAWVRINDEDFKGALKLFQDTIKGLAERKKSGESEEPIDERVRSQRRVDLRREALVDMVFPYVDVYKKSSAEKSLTYFREYADSRTSYLAALSKLAKRWFVKGEYKKASGIYREVLLLGADNEDALEWSRRLYDGSVKGKQFEYVAQDVGILAEIFRRRYYDWRLPNKERSHLFKEFEAYSRDLATRAQEQASNKKDAKMYALAGDAYERYLEVFSDSKQSTNIARNLAESRFEAKQFLEAGDAYSQVIGMVKGDALNNAVYTAVVAYNNALKEPWRLSRLDRAQARSGLRSAARMYIEQWPKDKNSTAVKFNLAKSYYDEGLFDESAELFAAMVEEYPTSDEAAIAAELALDSLRVREKFEDMARLGKRFSANSQLKPSVRNDIAQIVSSAETRALEVATLKAGYEGEQAAEGLMQFASRHKGTALGQKALINAFATAQNSDDLDKVSAIGEEILAQYPDAEVSTDVLATLGKMSAQAVDFERAAKYLEQAASKSKPDDSQLELLKASARLKSELGDTAGAQSIYQKLLSRSSGAAKREIALEYAELMEGSGDYREAARAYAIAGADGKPSADILFRLGYALHRAGRSSDAERYFKEAVQAGSNSADPEELQGAAGAQYFLMQPLYSQLSGIGYGGGAAQAIQKKVTALTQFEEAMFSVIEMQSPKWVLAALSRLAAAYADGAKFLDGVPAPAGLDGAAAKQFKDALKQKADEFRSKQAEALQTCAGKAAELKLLNKVAKACNANTPLSDDPEARPPAPGRGGSPPAGTLSALRKQIAKNSKDFDALVKLASAYLKADNPRLAKLVLDKAAEGGADSSVYNLRGVVWVKLGFPQEAHEDFQSALEKDSTNARARLNLAQLYQSYGFSKLAEGERVKVRSKRGISASDPGLLPGAGR